MKNWTKIGIAILGVVILCEGYRALHPSVVEAPQREYTCKIRHAWHGPSPEDCRYTDNGETFTR